MVTIFTTIEKRLERIENEIAALKSPQNILGNVRIDDKILAEVRKNLLDFDIENFVSKKTFSNGKTPVVIVPLTTWREIEERLEEAEMKSSVSYKQKIAKARAEKKLYSASEVRKILKL